MHGARAGAPEGSRNGQYRHGLYARDHVELRRQTSALLAAVKALAHDIG
jgi:hypothetical protein